jgi:hypothetical protein
MTMLAARSGIQQATDWRMAGAMAASVIARARLQESVGLRQVPQPQLHDAEKPTAHNGHLCYARRS